MKVVINGKTADVSSGKSAYEIAVENGFTGTEEEWLESLKGVQGDKGDTGPQGPKGDSGSSLEVYSTEETRIGTWINGKPLYRRVISIVNVQLELNSEVAIGPVIDYIDAVISIKGYVKKEADSAPRINVLGQHYMSGSFSTSTNRFSLIGRDNGAGKQTGFLVAEYTKTTDVASVNTLSNFETTLTSKVEPPSSVNINGNEFNVDCLSTTVNDSASASYANSIASRAFATLRI